ncbi:hypothetical protein K469DRAFT_711092 [Zopfia rhizophila CBS 207.26]|uniref:Uncharacterized protein n=1 Tax=Zopfia rhizophila CBS 207.26 TaxID=1314779 RepID=A0A6A6DTW4_9PEZI|nr:hypothetical protein K469DRAFT_711092 [Zopfia rhizophila CBS 207.26]
MNSNGDTVLNASTVSAGPVDTARKSSPPISPPTQASSPKAAKLSSPSSSREKPSPNTHLQNGDNGSDDAQNESEAETVVLGDTTKDETTKEKKVIKTERNDDDEGIRLRSVKEESRARSPAINGRKTSSSDCRDFKVNGAKTGSEHDAKSPIPTSPSSRTTSRHTKETSPADSVKSPAQSTTSPSQPTMRGRSSSTVESRKRKLRDESNPKTIEPPRQKAKTEGLKDPRTQPNSPATPGLGRYHKRSQSTQSILQGTTGRKRRELTAITLPSQDRKNWSDSSSENSSSPRPVQTPSLQHHTRVKRSSHRTLTSPARAMPHKKNVDKFGATRLARESEKGELSAVKAAYNAAPEELDQEDFAGITPLQKAALHGWAEVVEFLIEKGCRTDCESNDRDTPLIDAVENGHLDVVKLLLEKGKVNPHHQNKKGQRAIDVLDPDDEDAEEIEKELKAAMRREVDITKNEDYDQAGLNQQKSASRLLYNEYNQETLIEKAGDGDILAVGELINSNIKPNIACGVAAARGGHYDILSILLASGLKADPDPSKHSETPMLVAIGRGHIKIVNLLLEQDNFDPTRRNREGKTYYEISEDRRGPKWEQERDVLKSAYDSFRQTHKSPRRNKKEAPAPSSGIRVKRKLSPRRDRSSSPRPEPKRAHLTKSSTASHAPQKSRRLMSGKEMANQAAAKRRRRVVNEETSDDESEEEVRPPKKVVSKPRSFSDGEEQKLVKKAIKARSGDHDAPKRSARARSEDSDDEHCRGPTKKAVPKSERIHNAKPMLDTESPDERKPAKKVIKSRALEEKIKKRRESDVSNEEIKVKKTPTPSAKSTPAPPEKASTPESVRERRQEAERQAAEAKRKAAEAEARKREEEEAARKAAEEEAARKKAEEEAEAKRLAEEAEAARIAAEEEAKRLAAEEAKRAEERAARQARIAKLPRALRRACELGTDRPLHFLGEELGISAVFLPLFFATGKDLKPSEQQDSVSKSYIMSFQAVGILGLPELDLAHLDSPYCDWERLPVTRKQRELLLRQYDVALLAQDYRFPMEGTPEFDYAKIQESIKEARQRFLDMEGLYWIEDTTLYSEVDKVVALGPLVQEIKDLGRRRHLHIAEPDGEKATPEKKHRPRKSFMDVVLGQTTANGTMTEGVNGAG